MIHPINHGTFLDLSTAHLSPESIAWLTRQGRANEKANRKNDERRMGAISTLGTTGCGWFMAVPLTDSYAIADMPADLAVVCGLAAMGDCHYVLFDRDGPVHPALAVFDDKGRRAEPDDGAGLADELDEGRAALSDAAVDAYVATDTPARLSRVLVDGQPHAIIAEDRLAAIATIVDAIADACVSLKAGLPRA